MLHKTSFQRENIRSFSQSGAATEKHMQSSSVQTPYICYNCWNSFLIRYSQCTEKDDSKLCKELNHEHFCKNDSLQSLSLSDTQVETYCGSEEQVVY